MKNAKPIAVSTAGTISIITRLYRRKVSRPRGCNKGSQQSQYSSHTKAGLHVEQKPIHEHETYTGGVHTLNFHIAPHFIRDFIHPNKTKPETESQH